MKKSIYLVLCCTRICLVILPQTGYIHPDEHFQTSEVVYGDVLGLDVYRPWEYEGPTPIRSIIFPYSFVGIPGIFIRFAEIYNLIGTVSFPYLLMVIPRIFFCIVSFIHDFLIYKLCTSWKINPTSYLLFFASSYITFVYLTRPLSNSLESLFFSMLLYITLHLLQKDHFCKNESTFEIKSLMRKSFMLAIITIMGIFNRPTFTCYAVLPCLVVSYFVLKSKLNKTTKIQFFMSGFLGAVSLLVTFIAIDSLYYKKAHYSRIGDVLKNLVFTPLNFISYNANPQNLKSHGLHPLWLHSMINIPILFSSYGIQTLVESMKLILSFKYVFCIKNFLYLSFVIPLILLSLIPHQEPRFILPLLFPIVILGNFHNESSISRKVCVTLWCLQSIFAIVFYGFLHQSGVYQSLIFIHTSLKHYENNAVIFYKTYMPPRYLLGITSDFQKTHVYDFSISEHTIERSINEVLKSSPDKLYIAAPYDKINQFLNLPALSDYIVTLKKHFYFHLSMENLPFDNIKKIVSSDLSLIDKIKELQNVHNLNVIGLVKTSYKT